MTHATFFVSTDSVRPSKQEHEIPGLLTGVIQAPIGYNSLHWIFHFGSPYDRRSFFQHNGKYHTHSWMDLRRADADGGGSCHA